MKRSYIKIVINSLLISAVGIFVIDYFSHLFFSNPMETPPYFLAKATLYFLFSILFLSTFNLRENGLIKVVVAGIVVSSLWGLYYNVLPSIFDYYPFGIPLAGLTFLGMGILGTGIAFGTVHALAFIVGYYASKSILKAFGATDLV